MSQDQKPPTEPHGAEHEPAAASAPPSAPSPAPAPARPRTRRGRWLLATSLALPALLGAGGLGLYWALGTAEGSHWLLRQVPGLVLEAPEGALLGDFSAQRLSWRSPSFSLELQGLSWQGLRPRWDRSPELWGRLALDRLSARSLTLDWKTDPASPSSPAPQNLSLPVALELPQLLVEEIRLPGLEKAPLRQLQAAVWLGEQGGAQHRVQVQRLLWERLQLQGQAQVGSQGPMPVQAAVELSHSDEGSTPAPQLKAQLQLQGPLAELQLGAEAQVRVEGHTGQRLQLQAGLRPFASWPLAAAALSTENFDLQALSRQLPATALSGQAQLKSQAWEQAAELLLDLRNARAGRWDQERLPLRRLQLDLALRPDQWTKLGAAEGLAALQLRRLEARLGSEDEPGGELSASGTGLRLKGRLSELRSAALDKRLPRLALSGELGLEAPADGPGQALRLNTRLSGQFMPEAAAAQPLQLELQARYAAKALELEQARLKSGASELGLQGRYAPGPDGRWTARLQAQARDFDPRLLWAGPPGSAWARAPHKLQASLGAELQAQPRQPWPQGRLTLRLDPSLLAGQSLDGELRYESSATAPPAVQAELRAGANRLQLQAQGLGGATPLCKLDLDAPRLATLAPLLALAGGQPQLGGSARAQLELSQLAGSALQSSGSLDLKALKLSGLPGLSAPGLNLGSAQLSWRADSRADAPLRAEAQLSQLTLGETQLSGARLDLQGSWARHRLQWQAQGQTPTPDWAQSLVEGDTLGAQLNGSLSGQFGDSPWQALARTRGPLAWQGRLEQMRLQALPRRAELPDWLSLRDQDLALNLGSDGRLLAAEAKPGRLELAGAQISWRELLWQAARPGEPMPRVAMDLALEPLKVAPLLARWQPDFGWGGELVVGGRARVRSSPQVEVDMALTRAGGDLSVTEGRITQQLGLSDLHISLQAREGIWHLAQGLAGSNLGVLAGALSSRTSPQALWPRAQDPLEGVLQMDVANLGTWGAWVPAGWRLGGSFNAAFRLAGRVGAPELLGSARAAGLQLRNPLLGVDARDGELALALEGPSATLQSFSVRGGEGRITAQGRADLGAKPQLDISLQADKFTLLGRVDRRLVASGQARLQAGERSLSLQGQVDVDEGLFDISRGNAPSLDGDVQVLRRADPQAEQGVRPQARGGTAPPPKIDVQLGLDLGRQLRLKGHGVDTRLRGKLRLVHQGQAPQLQGTINTFGGTYDAYGQKLDIEKGAITFAGAVNNPRIDVLAVRPNTEIRVGVTVTGTAMDPRIKLFSDPDKSDTEKLSWLLLGRAPEGLGRTDTALLQRAALALLSGEGESFSGKLIRNLGLDEFSLGQDESDARGTVVRLGKQLSRRWYLGYERSLNATAGSWQLIYRLAQRFTLRAQAGEENALDLIWQWKWD